MASLGDPVLTFIQTALERSATSFEESAEAITDAFGGSTGNVAKDALKAKKQDTDALRKGTEAILELKKKMKSASEEIDFSTKKGRGSRNPGTCTSPQDSSSTSPSRTPT